MRKYVVFIATVLSVFGLTACVSNQVKIDYGNSDLYSQEDMNEAIALIEEEFAEWEGCELHRISYTSDECNNRDNIAWMNDLADEGVEYTQCIEFVSEFHSPKKGGGAWNPDCEYTDWGWWLARTDGGDWELMTWGY